MQNYFYCLLFSHLEFIMHSIFPLINIYCANSVQLYECKYINILFLFNSHKDIKYQKYIIPNEYKCHKTESVNGF